MDGLLIINKEKNMTSHDVVGKLRRLLNTKRIGHTGTLDPNATGVLVICVGEATKLVQFLEQDSKTYYAEVIIGKSTNTYDITGEITEKVVCEEIDKNMLQDVLNSFVTTYDQLPPIYSAIKVNGKKLYEYARNNQTVELIGRSVTINSIKWDQNIIKHDDYLSIFIEVDVSKGTYIRSLCYDIGKKLNIPCCMGELLRTRTGKFNLEQSKTLKDIELNNYEFIDMLDSISYTQYEITNTDFERQVTHGMQIYKAKVKCYLPDTPKYIAFTKDNKLKAIYELEDNVYKVARLWT